MKPLTWFRMYSEAIDDEKLRLLAFEDRWHFVALLCLKAKGILDEPNVELRKQKICVKLGLDSMELETVMKRLVTVNLVSSNGDPIAWSKRQYVSDSSTSRVRAFRKRFSNNSVTPSETETETETEIRGEKKRAARLPDSFELSEARRAVAIREGVDPERTFLKFCNYWKSLSGAKSTKIDWDRTWDNWCMTDRDRKPPPKSTRQYAGPTI